jgi:23S rRNA (uracil1939-C5)-methyltransferase
VRLTIESLAYGGYAVARDPAGRAVFVRGGCPGDVVEAHTVSDHGRYVKAAVTEVLEPSPDRVRPPCPYFGECGGCQWQHVAYRVQTSAKRACVADALRRIGHLGEISVDETVLGPSPYGYRNKVVLTASEGSDGIRLGFLSLGGGALVPIDSCLLLPTALQKAPKALTGILRYLSRNDSSPISRVAVRSASNLTDVEIDLWTEPGPFPRALAAKMLSGQLHAGTVTRVLTKRKGRALVAGKVEVLAGRGAWRERLGDHDFLVSAPSFFQVNTHGAERLIDCVVAAADVRSSDRVLDLYAGAGTFTLPLAELAGEVVAVEAEGSAVRDLRRNLEVNRLDAVVAPGDAAMALQGLGRFAVAIVDPPRTGMRPAALRALLDAGPRTIVYVSCDPATLARDASSLAEAGYRLTTVTPVDLFPQTYHVETVATFSRAPG